MFSLLYAFVWAEVYPYCKADVPRKKLLESVFPTCIIPSTISTSLDKYKPNKNLADLLEFYPLSVSPATVSMQCLMLRPIISRLKKPSQIPVQRILLVTVSMAWWLGILEVSSEEESPWASFGGILLCVSDHKHCCKTRKHWTLGTHHTTRKGSTWYLSLCRCWRLPDQIDEAK